MLRLKTTKTTKQDFYYAYLRHKCGYVNKEAKNTWPCLGCGDVDPEWERFSAKGVTTVHYFLGLPYKFETTLEEPPPDADEVDNEFNQLIVSINKSQSIKKEVG